MKTKIGTKVAHVTRDSYTTIKVTGRGHIVAAAASLLVTLSSQLIFSIRLRIHISKASNLLLSVHV